MRITRHRLPNVAPDATSTRERAAQGRGETSSRSRGATRGGRARSAGSAHGALVFAAFAAAAADATFALRGVLASHARLGSALEAFAVATAVVACPLLPLAFGAGLLWTRFRSLAIGACRLLARSAGGHGPLAAVTIAAALGAALTRSAIAGRAIVATVTPHLAAAAIVILVAGALAASFVAALVTLRIVGPLLVALERRAPWLRAVTGGAGARAALAAVIVAVLDALLPRPYAVAPAAGIVAWLLATSGVVRAAWAPRARGLRVRAFAAVLVVGTFVAPHALARLPGRARLGVAELPPYGSLVLGAARRITDRDGDGYARVFGGGDCDDANPAVHPGARDVPGNGIDENCSGADATSVAAPEGPAAVHPASLPDRPNIVIVLVDALRPDRLGFAGNTRATSPHIDRFRAGATWFRRTYTPAPSTRFALSSMFTGEEVQALPQRRGPGSDFELLPAAETLAERLDELGYDRAGFTISHVTSHIAGVGQGFRVWGTPWPASEASSVVGRDAPLTTDAALAFLASTADDGSRPYLLFTHYQCTHAPYVRHAEHDFGGAPLDLYDSALAYCDEHVGRLLDGIDARKDRDRTIVVVASDHGELVGEHGVDQHGSSLLEPAVRALLLVRVPGIATTPTVDAPVMLTDLHPTLLSLCGAPASASRAWDLTAFLFGAPEARERPLFLYVDDWRAGVHYQVRAVVDGTMKFVRDLPSGTEQLFELGRDPAEERNLRRRRPQVRDRLSALLDSWDAGVDFH